MFSFVETPRKFIIAKLGSSSVLIIRLFEFTHPFSNSRIISTDEDRSLRIESSAIINLRGVSTKLNKYIIFTMQTYKELIIDKSDRNFMNYITKATSKLNFQAVSESTVHRLLLSLNPRKFTGIDKIPAKIIRIASPVIANSLTKIFNCAISNESFPSEWKQARVAPSH